LTLSKETIGKLADALTLEVIDYIVNNPKTNTFLYEMVTEALCEKLGNKNEDGSCSFDGSFIAPAVLDNITLTLAPNNMPSDPASLWQLYYCHTCSLLFNLFRLSLVHQLNKHLWKKFHSNS